MRKSLMFMMIGLLMLGTRGNVWAGKVVAADLVCTNPAGCVQTDEISDGAVTNSKIADGVVTNSKITGPISASKLEKPANVVVVAKSGGDFTSIAAAMAAINPTEDNPYIIKVMPGTYIEPSFSMKSYVHINGAGRDTAKIYVSAYQNIICTSVTHVTISGITLTTSSYADPIIGIAIGDSSFVTIENSRFIGFANFIGIMTSGSTEDTNISRNIFINSAKMEEAALSIGSGTPSVRDNLFRGNYSGIKIYQGAPVVKDNIFTDNSHGIIVVGGTPTIKDNTLSGSYWAGLALQGGTPLVLSNKSNNNTCDIRLYASSPHVSYNVFDTLCVPWDNSTYVGKYNLKTDGTDAPTAP